MYELPDQRDANLSILGKLQQQLQTIGDVLKSTQDRKLIIQKQLTEMRNMSALLNRQEDFGEEKASSFKHTEFAPSFAEADHERS